MSFETDLQRATAHAHEYTRIKSTIQGMAVAEDHDPNWTASDTAKLDALQREHGELGRQLTAELAQLASAHREPWRAFLSSSLDRLRFVAAHERIGSYAIGSFERDEWTKWLDGVTPDDPAEIFARGLGVLAEHGRSTIDP